MRPLPISEARNPVNFRPFLHFGLTLGAKDERKRTCIRGDGPAKLAV